MLTRNVTVEVVNASRTVKKELRRYVQSQTKYKHQLVNLNEVEFFMVKDDYEKVRVIIWISPNLNPMSMPQR